MKTTLDIPEKLLAEAMRATGATTKRDVVMRVLEDFNRRNRLKKLIARLGRSETFMTSDELRDLRSRVCRRRAKTRETNPARQLEPRPSAVAQRR